MAWPSWQDFNDAVQNPDTAFADAELLKATVTTDALGLPKVCSGNFAVVYQMRSAEKNKVWAVKCFTKPVQDRHLRYRAISEHLGKAGLPFTVAFTYQQEGVRIRGAWYPIVKMDWVEGQTLNQFAGSNLDRPARFDNLSQMWLKLAKRLKQVQVTHGDLQHGNVLLVPGVQENTLSLKLVDYDGLYVPALAKHPSGELGLPAYQHPQRVRDRLYSPEVDRFSHLVAYTALRALRHDGAGLWKRYDTGENLLFTGKDFTQPGESKLLRELWQGKREDLAHLAGRITLAARGPLRDVPELEDVASEDAVKPLGAKEQAEVEGVLGRKPPAVYAVMPAPPPTGPMPVPTVTLVRPAPIKAQLVDEDENEEEESRSLTQRPILLASIIGGLTLILGIAIGVIIMGFRTPAAPAPQPIPPWQVVQIDQDNKDKEPGPGDLPNGMLPDGGAGQGPGQPGQANPPLNEPPNAGPGLAPAPGPGNPGFAPPPARPEDANAVWLTVTPNKPFTGSFRLEQNGWQDRRLRYPAKVFLVNMTAGRKYVIDQQAPRIHFDSYLRVENAAGDELAYNDDGGGYPNARIEFTPKTTGMHRILATSLSGGVGEFTLSIRDASGPGAAAPMAGGPMTKPAAPGFNPGVNEFANIPVTKVALQKSGGYRGSFFITATDPLDPVQRHPCRMFEVSMEAGKTYTIEHSSNSFDAYVRILDKTNAELDVEDSGGVGKAARLDFQPFATAPYRIVATSFSGGQGAFSLSIQARTAKDAAPRPGGLGGFGGGGLGFGGPGADMPKEKVRDVKTNLEITGRLAAMNNFNLGGLGLGGDLFKELAFRLEANVTYTFELSSKHFDPFMRLLDQDRLEIDSNDDVGNSKSSRIVFRPTQSGVYYIEATTLDDRGGDFILRVKR